MGTPGVVVPEVQGEYEDQGRAALEVASLLPSPRKGFPRGPQHGRDSNPLQTYCTTRGSHIWRVD